MPNLPSLSADQVAMLIPKATNVKFVDHGGQKMVFRCELDGANYALKFVLVPPAGDDGFDLGTSEVERRAQREVDTMRDCTSKHMVKLGPIGFEFAEVDSQRLLYFSEEFVDGTSLMQVIKQAKTLPAAEVRKLGLHGADAIKALWDLGKIHRDIKPANIMKRNGSGDFVLLDAGFAFDVADASLSAGIVGTPAFFSPEQLDFASRRNVMDFRSDIFSLGVTLYMMATGKHPFMEPGDGSHELYSKIKGHTPVSPSDLVNGFPQSLSEIILRMMGKSPHLRFRRCDQLIAALQAAGGI